MGAFTRNPVGRVHAYGSIRSGAGTWLHERLSGLALLPLSLWFLLAAVSLSGATYEEVRAWLAGPVNTTLMLLFVVLAFWHARLGIRVVIEDYVHHEGWKLGALLANTWLHVLVGTACVVAILKVSLGS